MASIDSGLAGGGASRGPLRRVPGPVRGASRGLPALRGKGARLTAGARALGAGATALGSGLSGLAAGGLDTPPLGA